MRVVSKKLRDSAHGESCTLRLDGCRNDQDTVVLAHLPCGQKGIGMKSPDMIGVYACCHCHAIIDGAGRWDVHAKDYLRALAETQMRFIEKGLLKIEGMK